VFLSGDQTSAARTAAVHEVPSRAFGIPSTRDHRRARLNEGWRHGTKLPLDLFLS
jgi:hypothetical protein